MEWWKDLEGTARWVLEEAGTCIPTDIEALANACGFHVERGDESRLERARIVVDGSVSPIRQRARIAHELGHWALVETGVDDTPIGEEAAADWIGGALLVPFDDLRRELRVRAWNIAALPARYDVSWEVLARRIPQVSTSIASIVDNGRLSWRGQSPWLERAHGPGMSAYERELAIAAAETLEHQHDGAQTGAWVVPAGDSPDWIRVVVVAGVDEIEARATG